VARALEGCDAVYHIAGTLAAPTLKAFREGNWLVSKCMVEAALVARVPRFVHVSSLAAAGPSPDGRALDEDAPCAPVSMYGRTKLEGEREVLRHADAMQVTVIRPPAVYGPRDRGLLDMFKVVAGGVLPLIGGPKRVSIVHVEDLVRGIVEAPAGVYFLANERAHSVADLLEVIRSALGRRALRVAVPDRVVRLLGRVAEKTLPWLGKGGLFSHDKAVELTQPFWVCSPARARRVFGWQPRIPIERGLADTLAWYRAEKWL
jgi:nucleoside-diphosphate-sugar epimerase